MTWWDFSKNRLGVTQYVEGEGRTFLVDADELCWFYLEKLAQNCRKYSRVDEIYYLVLGSSFFRKVWKGLNLMMKCKFY